MVIDLIPEIQKCFGEDLTVGALKFQVSTAIRPTVARIHQARAAGQDCKELGIGLGLTDKISTPSKGGKGPRRLLFLNCFAQHSI
jgi:hypothetical protein